VAQELLVLVHCDRHLAQSKTKTGNGKTLPVMLDGALREVDLCPGCEDDLLGPLRAALAEYGRRPREDDTAPPPPPTVVDDGAGRHKYRCPYPGCGEAVTGVRLHVRRIHGREAELQYLKKVDVYACPEPGCPQKELTGTTGLSMHFRATHQISEPVHSYIARHGLTPR